MINIGLEVFVSTSGQVEDQDVFRPETAAFEDRKGMGGFNGRDDALQGSQLPGGSRGLRAGHGCIRKDTPRRAGISSALAAAGGAVG